jgi:hypothetical protein
MLNKGGAGRLTGMDLFLSHSKRDSHAVLKLLEKLRLVSYTVWFDADGGIGAGDRWKENMALYDTVDWARQSGLTGTAAGSRCARVEFHKVTPRFAEDLRKPRDFVVHLPQRLAALAFPRPLR